MQGRKPIPNKLKLIRGNPGSQRIIERPEAPAGRPDCPDELNELARGEWARVTGELEAMRTLSAVHRSAITAYCRAWQRWHEAEEILEREGIIYVTTQGIIKRHPATAIADNNHKKMVQLLCEFGLTPASSQRVPSPKIPESGKSRFFGSG